MPRLISQCRANKDAVCRFASCPSGSAEWIGSNQFDHDLPDQAGWICSDPLGWICSTTELLICGCSRYAGRTDPHSVRTWGWVTSETAARQKFIGNQYFAPPSSTSVQGLSDMEKDTTGVARILIFCFLFKLCYLHVTLEIKVRCIPEQISVDHDVTFPQKVSLWRRNKTFHKFP